MKRALLVLCALVASCGTPVQPRSTIQQDALAKRDLEGTWYFRQTVIGVPFATGFTFPGEQGENEMETWVTFYKTVFGFERFASFDDKDISTEFTALRSVVVAAPNNVIKFPINEPAPGKRKSQIQEYVESYGGAGVQHLAFLTNDIVGTIVEMRKRGVDFLEVPDTYYETVSDRVGPIDEDMAVLKSLKILIDRDDKGYLLQLFSQPVQDRPTLFIEIIQRKGSDSFGKGNFKALFESIERAQAARGNL